VSGWHIREERAGDEAAIHRVTEAAFTDHPYSEGAEPEIIERLRADGELLLSLVAEGATKDIVGHAAFSPACLSNGDDRWVALGPISVEPALQRNGIGSLLIERAVTQLRGSGAKGIVLLGDPAFYGRFGFVLGTPLFLEAPLAAYFQVLAFTSDIPAASVTFAPAFAQARPRNR
jgi:predicted N-acetyltransferase YhbS